MSRLPLVLLACTGCAQMLAQLQTSQSNNAVDSDGVHHVIMDGRTERVGPYWGPECERIDAPHRTAYRDQEADPTMGKQPNLAHNPEDQVLRLVCVDSIMSVENEPERNTYVIQHFRFDELYFDNFTAALMLVQCYEADDCLGTSAVKPHREYHNPYVEKEMAAQAAEGPRVYQLYQTGMMRWYADHIDVAAVQQRIAKLPLPPQAQQVFMSLLERAKTGIVQLSDQLAPDAKRLFVDLPAAVYVQRQKARSKHDKLIAELGQVIDQMKTERAAGGVSDGTVDRLDKLRIAYTAACGRAPSCTRDAIFTELTTQLFWAHVARGDAPAARAESKLLEHVDDTAAQEIAEKQSKAIEEARGRLERVARAREQGVDADAAQSTANGRVVDFGDGRYVYRWHDDFKIYWESLIPDGHGLAAFEGKVAGLDRKGNQVTLKFADIVSSWSESTNCYETGRVESIDSDGHLHYREECAGSTTRTERHKVDPVTVVASELGGIGPGDEVFGFAHGDRTAGRVWFVKRGQRVVRVRDVPQ